MPCRQIVFVGCLPMPTRLAEAGGMGIVGIDLLNGLSRCGHRVRVLAPLSAADSNPGLIGLRDQIAVNTYSVPQRVHEPTSTEHFDLHASRIREMLPAMLGDGQADVVLVGHHAYLGAFPDTLSPFGVPWMAWVHGSLAPVIMFGEGPAPDALARQILDSMCQADLVVGVAEHVTAGLDQIGVRSLAAVPNGVDTRRFRPADPKPDLRAKLGLDDDAVIVLHASNLKKVKRIPDLVGSALQAIEQDARLTYVILGDGPFKADIEQAFAEADKTEHLRILGWVERSDMPNYLALADIVVMTSQAEGSPLALIEAQAAGRAVIASDNAACRALIRDNETGMLFPIGDVDALSACTLRLANNPAHRAMLGRNARAHIEQHHDIRLMVERFGSLIETLIN